MELLAVGLSHRTASVAVRERASLTPPREAALLRALSAESGVFEAVALSTCNRTEVYAVVCSRDQGIACISEALVEATSIGAVELRQARYALSGSDAAEHLLRVAASLDSLVIGESEIQGQVRRALTRAQAAGTAGPELRELFRRALITGKRVRRQTNLGRGVVSVAQAAVEQALPHLPDLEECRALLLGAGRAAEATARTLVGHGLGELAVMNRSGASAARLAERFDGRAAPLTHLACELAAADVVVCSTSSDGALVGVDSVRAALRRRSGAQLVLIDIAVPRDVDPSVRRLDGVVMIDLDDLEAVVRENAGRRRREAERAAWIVGAELNRYVGTDLAA